jgi:hypothetical protein
MNRFRKTLVLAGGIAICATAAGATPPLAQPNWTSTPPVSVDPQIAAGTTRVVVTSYDTIRFYKKDGTPVTHVDNDSSKPALPLYVKDIFKPLWDPAVSPNINDSLNLPPQAPCFRSFPEDDYIVIDGDKFYNYCLTRFAYDSRVLYDEFRDRFVIVAHAFNPSSKCRYNPKAIFDARRNKLLVAYSNSPDPTDGSGWKIYYFDAVPGEGCTTAACQAAWNYHPGDAADYPVVALNRNTLMISMNTAGKPSASSCTDPDDDPDSYPSRTSTLHVWNADAFATGTFNTATCDGICSWVYFGNDLKDSCGNQVTHTLTPAHTHGSSFLGDGWFAQRDCDASTGEAQASRSKVNFWHFSIAGSASRPPLFRATATLPAFDMGDRDNVRMEYPQPVTATTSNPQDVLLDWTASLVQQDEMFYLADVGGMNGGGAEPDASIRLTGLIPQVVNGAVSFSIGRDTIYHHNGQGYGSPALEVDEDRTIVMTYRKAGLSSSNPSTLAGFGARYITWTAGDPNVPGGEPLANNQNSTSGSGTASKWDTVGISLAPGGRVYMMQPFVNASAGWSYAINFINP